MKTIAIITMCSLVSTLSCAVHGAYNYYLVPPGTPGVPENPDYTSWATAGTNIYDAIYLAGVQHAGSDGNEKNIAHLLYIKTGTYLVTNQLYIGDCNTEIRSSKGPEATQELDREGTILCGGYAASTNRIFLIAAGSVSRPVKLRGLTIKNGYANNGSGGGVLFSGSNRPDTGMYDCTVLDCVSRFGRGGGIAFYPTNNRSGIITNCWVSGCLATNEFVLAKRTNAVGGGGIAMGFEGSQETRTSTRTEGFRIFDTVVSNNVSCGNAICGSGLFVISMGAWVEGCTFVDNFGDLYASGNTGYGGVIQSNGRSQVVGCVFKNNSSKNSKGPCALNTYAGATVSNCTFVANDNETAPQPVVSCAGDVWTVRAGTVWSGAVEVVSCSFYGRDTGNVPALTVGEGSIVRNCFFSGFGGLGGGAQVGTVSFNTGRTTFENNTIVECNKALYCAGTVDPFIWNCAFYGNAQDLHQATKVSGHVGISFSNCYFTAQSTIGSQPNFHCVSSANPKFVDSANGDYRLRCKSPLRDAGVWQPWMVGASDLDGKPRLVDMRGKARSDALPDIGCYECSEKPKGLLIVFE